jgi:hypothetical protein
VKYFLIHSLYIYLLPISDDLHDLKNELEETRSAYRNRKADVIALQTELNTANENIMNMTRVVDENSDLLERLKLQESNVKATEAEFILVKLASENMSNYVNELQDEIDGLNVFRIKNEESVRRNEELIVRNEELVAWEELYIKGEREREVINDKNLLIEAQSDILRQNIQMTLFEKQEIEVKMQQLSELHDGEGIRMNNLIRGLKDDLELMRDEKNRFEKDLLALGCKELLDKEANESLFKENQELIRRSNEFTFRYAAKEEEMELLISANSILIEAEKEKVSAGAIVYEVCICICVYKCMYI